MRLFVVLLTCLCLLGTAVRAQDDPPIIRAAVVNGFVNLPEAVRAQVRGMAEARVGLPYTDTLARNLEAEIFALGWFSSVTVTSEPVQDGVLLRVTVVENPVVREIRFPGNTVLPESVLRAAVQTVPGEVLNRNLVEADTRRINAEYQRRGYILNGVAATTITPEGVLSFEIAETRVAEVRIEGLRRTREETVQQEITVEPGEVFNILDVRESVFRINRLGIFSSVNATYEPGPDPNTVIVTFIVEEAQTGQINFGVTYSEGTGLSGYVSLSQRNFRGRAERLQATVQFGADSAYSISYFNPRLNDDRTSLGASLYDTDNLRVATLNDMRYQYRESRTGGNLTLGQPTGRARTTSLTLRVDDVESRPDNDDTIPSVLITSYDVRSITAASQYDTRDDLFDATRGAYNRTSAEYAGFGGVEYLKGQLDARRYWPVARRPREMWPTDRSRRPVVFATRFLAGATSDDTPFPDQFFLGGPSMLRGYKEDAFVGTRMLYSSNELRYPISSSLQLVAFVDAGSAWGGPVAQAYGDPEFTLRGSIGAGVRLNTPVGPFRFEYAVNSDQGSEFHFAIGPTF